MVEQDINDFEVKTKKEQKLFKASWSLGEEKKKNVINPADKGGGIVILSWEDYNQELNSILGDEDSYIKLRGGAPING